MNGTQSLEHAMARTYTTRGQLKTVADGPPFTYAPPLATVSYNPDGQINT
jgi:hypothetical protein